MSSKEQQIPDALTGGKAAAEAAEVSAGEDDDGRKRKGGRGVVYLLLCDCICVNCSLTLCLNYIGICVETCVEFVIMLL